MIIPGMGSTLANFTSGVAIDAERLWRRGGETSAVIAWTGYDAPAGLERGLAALQVTSSRQAEVGGASLHSFVDGLHTQSKSPVTLIGHSYGSVAVGKALLGGAQVTNVVFIGSPGVGVDRVSDFPAGAADRFYAGEVKGDPVATLEYFGDSPTDPDFSARVFDAGPGNAINPMARHSEYFDDGTAIDNLVAITRGEAPTPGAATRVEQVLELQEDFGDAMNSATDFPQRHVPVPFLDRYVDAGIDGTQSFVDSGRKLAAGVAEMGGHLLEDGADKVTDFIGDTGRDALDVAGDVMGFFKDL